MSTQEIKNLIQFEPDGDMICCHLSNFKDLMESPAAFGKTEQAALGEFLSDWDNIAAFVGLALAPVERERCECVLYMTGKQRASWKFCPHCGKPIQEKGSK